MSDVFTAAAGWMLRNRTENLPRIRTASDLENIEIGSLLIFETTFQHYAVFIGGGQVVHLNVNKQGRSGAFASTGNGQGYVSLDYVSEMYKGETVSIFVDNSRDRERRPHSPADIVRRAMGKLGPVGYDLIFNNCEHFATWCRYGQGESTQVQRAANIASAVGQFASRVLFGNSDGDSASTVGQIASAMAFGDSGRNRGSTRGHFASMMGLGDPDSDSDSDTPQASGITFTFF